MKKFYPTKLPSKQGLALVINGLKSTDKSFIANSICEYFSTVTRNLYQEQICSAEENIPNQEFRYTKIHIFALRWRDEIRRSSQLRTLLKLVVVNRT